MIINLGITQIKFKIRKLIPLLFILAFNFSFLISCVKEKEYKMDTITTSDINKISENNIVSIPASSYVYWNYGVKINLNQKPVVANIFRVDNSESIDDVLETYSDDSGIYLLKGNYITIYKSEGKIYLELIDPKYKIKKIIWY